MTDWTLSPYTIYSGFGEGEELIFDDIAINACRHDKSRPSNCQFCPARRRCDELVRAEWARELGLEPPEES